MGPFRARIYPDFPAERNASQKPQCTVIRVFEKPLKSCISSFIASLLILLLPLLSQ